MSEHVADPAYRRIVDVAFSGNGEPTTAERFDEIVALVMDIADELQIEDLSRVLITNGSMMGRAQVQRGLDRLHRSGGEVWFKLDQVTREARAALNGSNTSADSARAHLRTAAAHCRTRLQTCVFALDGAPPSATWCDGYLDFVGAELEAGTPIADVLLYGLARPSMQPEADRLGRLPEAWLEAFADRIRDLGLPVVVRP